MLWEMLGKKESQIVMVELEFDAGRCTEVGSIA